MVHPFFSQCTANNIIGIGVTGEGGYPFEYVVYVLGVGSISMECIISCQYNYNACNCGSCRGGGGVNFFIYWWEGRGFVSIYLSCA